MARKLLIVGFLLSCLSTVGQKIDNTNKRAESNIYNQSLIQYFKFKEKDNFIFPDSIFIEYDRYLTDSLIPKIGTKQLIVIGKPDHFGISDIFENITGGITLYQIFPLAYKNNEFIISIIPCSINNDHTNYIYSESYKVIFKFKCNRFKFKRIDWHGI
jgi:hypothetical protein